MKKNELSRQGAIATMALASFLRPRLAQDAKLSLLPVFNGITFKNYTDKKGDILRRIEKACKGKIAIDTSLGEVAEFLDMLDGGGNPMEDDDEMPPEMEKPVKEVGEKFAEPDQMDADPLSAVMSFLKDKLRPEDLKQVMEMLKGGGIHEHEEGAKEGGDEDVGQSEQSEGPAAGEKQLEKLGAADNEENEGILPNKGGNKLDTKETRKHLLEGGKEGAKDAGAETEQEHEDNQEEWRRDHHEPTTDQPPEFKGSPQAGGKMAGDKKYVTVAEMQNAIASATKVATDAAQKVQREIREAERVVQPYVGNLVGGLDSAEDVYRKALKIMGVTGVDKVHASALRPILEMQPKPGARRTTTSVKQAADEATSNGFFTRYPEASRIRLT